MFHRTNRLSIEMPKYLKFFYIIYLDDNLSDYKLSSNYILPK